MVEKSHPIADELREFVAHHLIKILTMCSTLMLATGFIIGFANNKAADVNKITLEIDGMKDYIHIVYAHLKTEEAVYKAQSAESLKREDRERLDRLQRTLDKLDRLPKLVRNKKKEK